MSKEVGAWTMPIATQQRQCQCHVRGRTIDVKDTKDPFCGCTQILSLISVKYRGKILEKPSKIHSVVALNVKSRPVPSLLSPSLKCRCTSHLYSGVVDLAMSTRTKLLLQTFIYGNIDTNIVRDLRQKRSKECPN